MRAYGMSEVWLKSNEMIIEILALYRGNLATINDHFMSLQL
jgi:hypothetical protein